MSMNHQQLKGNSYQRRARKIWLLSEDAGYGGNGHSVACVFCAMDLTFDTVTADRIVPGSKGGTYSRDNLQPACLSCNSSRQDREDWTPTASVVGSLAIA